MYHVLLVEDEEPIRTGLRLLIEEDVGFFKVAKEASTALEALRWIEHQGGSPDLVITDIRMNGMNGIELIDKLRAMLPDIPILIISGYNDFEYAKKAIRFRVDDYLLKPIDRVELTQHLIRLKKKLDAGGAEAAGTRPHAQAAEQDHDKKIIQRVKQIIHAHVDQDISLQLVADKIHMNPQYISALFKTETGQNFVDYVIECRIARAKQLLKETHLKIYEVARLSGYDNVKYFMTVFKHHAGVTPSSYRENPL